MTPKEREKEFYKFLQCKIDLLLHFVVRPSNGLDTILFKDEFTFDNWISGKIGRRLYKTGFKTIYPTIMNKREVENDKTLAIGYEYSIFRFVNYNFKRKTITQD